MSPDNESCAMKGSSRPPPPVPPRPSRSVVKEALAKTRQAYGIVHGSRVSLSEKNPDEFLNRQTIPLTTHQLQQYNMGQPRFSLGSQNTQIDPNQKSVPCFPSEKLCKNYGMRPVVYQSQNCRNRPTEDNKTTSIKNVCISHIDNRPSQLVGKSSFREDLLKKGQNSEMAPRDTSCDNPINRGSPKLVDVEPKYANILEQKTEVKEHDGDASRKPSSEEDVTSSNSSSSTNSNTHENVSGKQWDDILNDRNHVNTLIDEMFASVLEVNLGSSISPSSSNESIANEAPNKITISHNTPQLAPKPTNNNSDDENLTVIVINEDQPVSESTKSSTSASERKVTFNDRENHEFLIEELQSMQHHQGKVAKRQHLGSLDSVNGVDKIHMNDWYGVNDGKKVRLSSCHITIEDPCEDGDQISKRNQKINNISRAYRLPPLPKSLSGFKLLDNSEGLEMNESMQTNEKVHFNYSEQKVDVSGREQTNLDRQLALLRREMVSLREQDLSLLSKLWFLSESIHDFRQMMQEQDDDKINARLSPSPTPSSIDDEDYYVISASTC